MSKTRFLHMIIALLLTGCWSCTPVYAGAIVEITASENAIIVKFDDVVYEASIFTLSGPNRITVDVTGATTGGSVSAGGPVSSVRQGQFDPDTARIVFDLGKPALIIDGQFSSDGRSLRLDLRQAAVNEFAGSLRTVRKVIFPPANFRSSPLKKRYEVTAPIGREVKANGLPRIYGPADESLPVIVIDAGHGGRNSGAISPHAG